MQCPASCWKRASWSTGGFTRAVANSLATAMSSTPISTTRRGRHASCFFYDQVGPEAVAQDVSAADKCLRDVLGIRPARLPYASFRYLPAAGAAGVPARTAAPARLCVLPPRPRLITPSAMGRSPRRTGWSKYRSAEWVPRPLTILDSWACFAAPDRTMTSTDYLREAAGAGRNYRQAGSGILNYYADPSHIHDQAEFIRAVESWLTIAEPVNYRSLLEKTNVHLTQSDSMPVHGGQSSRFPPGVLATRST